MRDVVREALEAARAAARPGITGRELYDMAAEIIERAGHPTQRTTPPGETLTRGFYFSLGHGVGLEVHEPPGLGLFGRDPLVAGDVVAVEPGVEGVDGIGGVGFESAADHRGRERDADRLPSTSSRPTGWSRECVRGANEAFDDLELVLVARA